MDTVIGGCGFETSFYMCFHFFSAISTCGLEGGELQFNATTGYSGTIKSPRDPNLPSSYSNYFNNAKCTWTISNFEGIIELTFDDFKYVEFLWQR